jgi:hypothetical protein
VPAARLAAGVPFRDDAPPVGRDDPVVPIGEDDPVAPVPVGKGVAPPTPVVGDDVPTPVGEGVAPPPIDETDEPTIQSVDTCRNRQFTADFHYILREVYPSLDWCHPIR